MAYRGRTVHYPLGRTGLVGDPDYPDPGSMVRAENIRFTGDVSVESGLALHRIQDPTNAPVVSLFGSVSVGQGDNNLIVARGSSIHFGSGHSVSIGQSSIDHPPVFVEIIPEHSVAMFSPRSAPLVWSSEGTRYLENPPNEWTLRPPRLGAYHRNRLWAFTDHRVYYSSAEDPFTFTSDEEDFSGGSISIYPDEGQHIVAASSFRGLMLVWKYPDGLFAIDTGSSEPTQWSVRRLSPKLGACSPRAVSVIDNDLIFMDPSGGLHLLSAVEEFGDISTSDLSDLRQIDEWIRRNVDLSRLHEVSIDYLDGYKEVHIILPRINETNIRMVASFKGPSIRVSIDTSGDPTTITTWRELAERQQLFLGMRDGSVYRMDQTPTGPSPGLDYMRAPSAIWTVPTDLSFALEDLKLIRKSFDFIELYMKHEGDVSLSLDVEVDGSVRKRIQLNLAGDSPNSRLDTAELNGWVLEEPKTEYHQRRLGLSGTKIAFRISDAGSVASSFEILEIRIGFRISDIQKEDTGDG